MGWDGVGMVQKWWRMDGKGYVLLLLGGYFLYNIFSGFAIDRSKKYIKTTKNHMKIDVVNPQAAADNPPHPPVTMVRCPGPYNPPNLLKPRQTVRCLGMLTHARSYLNPAAAAGGGLTSPKVTWPRRPAAAT